ncbi:hypothetical protein Hanom_Chr06g00573181 [Helianthus anomalus]
MLNLLELVGVCLRLYVDGLLVRVKWMIVVVDHLWQLGGFLKGLIETTLVNICSGVQLTNRFTLFVLSDCKMVKTVIGEEIRLTSVEDRLSKSSLSCQVGLVIGKTSTSLDRGFVFNLVLTPVNDAGEPASWIVEGKEDTNKKKGGSKSQSQSNSLSSLLVDKDWVAEHARQVSGTLLGGMKVVGIYISVNESLFKNSTLVFCRTVKGVADAVPIRDSNWDERLLIHISYSPRRWTCKNCSMSSNITSSSLRLCDSKMGRVLSTLQTFKCHAEELKGAKALIDGNLVDVDEQYASMVKEDVVGILVFTGSICSFAYSNSKEPISQALVDIKGDIISSLYSRLDVICDEIDEQMDSVADGSGNQ